ncbi:MAG: hypothetical protein RR202_01160 [Bacteroidales bacterium]
MTSFFSKLLPVESLFIMSSDSITAYGILIILLIFFAFFFSLTRRIGALTSSIRKMCTHFSEKGIASDVNLGQQWKEYKSTFTEALGSVKTDEYASDYFNPKSLLFDGTNISLVSAGPNILTGLGVLGTFTGLTMGISDFDTDTADTIKASIQMLLSGMGSAFATSIWGMLLSLLLTYVEKSRINKLSLSVHALNTMLDKRYKLSRSEERLLALQEQQEMFARYFSFEDSHGNQLTMGQLLSGIHDETRQLNDTLDDIRSGEAQKPILAALEELRKEIGQVAKDLNDPATEMTQRIVEELKDALGVMMEDFRQTMSSSALSELDELAKILNVAGKNMADLPSRMESLSANLDITFGNLRELLSELSNSTLGQQAETVKSTEILLRNFAQSIQRMEAVNRKVELSIGQIANIQENVSTTCNAMREFSTSMHRSSDNFLISQESFGNICENFLKENSRVVSEITSLVHITSENARENEERFETIRTGLHDIFAQIEEGLVQYQGTVGSSIRSYLSEFTQHLTSATSSLASESSKQADLLEELNEMLSKVKR